MTVHRHEAIEFTYDSPSTLASDASWGLMLVGELGLTEEVTHALEGGLRLCTALAIVGEKRGTRRASPEVTSTARRLYASQVSSLVDKKKLAERGAQAAAVFEDLLAANRVGSSSDIAEWKDYFAALAAALRDSGL